MLANLATTVRAMRVGLLPSISFREWGYISERDLPPTVWEFLPSETESGEAGGYSQYESCAPARQPCEV